METSSVIIANGTIVAVVDGSHFRLFRNRGREPDIELVAEPEPDLHKANMGSGGRHRSTTANPDRSRIREDNFAASVAAYLNREVLAGRIGHLVVVADARTLGELRLHFHHSLSDRLAGQVEKDLTGLPVRGIENALRAA